MSDLITQFEQDCARAEVTPSAVLTDAGIHKSLWWKWKEGKVSPTLRSFEAARRRLDTIIVAKGREAA